MSLQLVILALVASAAAQCPLPNAATINNDLQTAVRGLGTEGNSVTTSLIDHKFTCLAVSNNIDQYRRIAIAVNYTTSASPGTIRLSQFVQECRIPALTFDTTEFEPTIIASVFDSDTRRDCRACIAMFPPTFCVSESKRLLVT